MTSLLMNYGKPILLTKNQETSPLECYKNHTTLHRRVTVLNTLREACHCQSEFGGRICAIQQEIEKEVEPNMQYLLHLKHHQ